MASVLARRQPDVALVLEDVHDPHNVSAVLRSCDATGVPAIHLVYTDEEPPELSGGAAAGTQHWLDVHHHGSVNECYAQLRRAGMRVYATTIDGTTVDLHDVDLTRPCAFVFGNESRGLSADAAGLADARLKIPMMGMAESLNISVASAVTLYEMLRQRRDAGRYRSATTPARELRETLAAWLQRDDRDPRQAAGAHFDPDAFPSPRIHTHARPLPRRDAARRV
jgi:tRNA (guanosine-2'-O-)-methyltransferase